MADIINLEIDQGATFTHGFQWVMDGVIVDLIDYDARMQIRRVSNGSVVIDISTSSSGITIDSVNKVVLLITSIETSIMEDVQMVYDLELIKGDFIKRLVQGHVRLNPNITI